MLFKRFKTSEFTRLAKAFPAICILGPRQVGKTTFAKQISNYTKKKCIYLDLENPVDLQKIQDPYFFLKQHEKKCVILDEVQHLPNLFSVLRSLIDEYRKPLRFVLLGSAAPTLLQKTSETLAGRIAFMELHPLSRVETDKKINLNKNLFRGGFPGSLLAKNDLQAVTWQENFIRTYIERDLPALGMPANQQVARKLWEMLAWQNGSLLNTSSLAASLGLSNKTVAGYLDYLEGAFMIYRLRPYHINVGKRLIKSPKVYVCDNGILHRLLGINGYDQLSGSPFIGASWESFVINQIRSITGNDFNLFFYRTQAGAEMDLVICKGIMPVACIEIKYAAAPSLTKGYYTSLEDLKTKKNFIIIPQGESYKPKKGIEVCDLDTFLNQKLLKL